MLATLPRECAPVHDMGHHAWWTCLRSPPYAHIASLRVGVSIVKEAPGLVVKGNGESRCRLLGKGSWTQTTADLTVWSPIHVEALKMGYLLQF